eukprot:symbB.v1.2.034380.t1/scaffold4427.1/size39785/3
MSSDFEKGFLRFVDGHGEQDSAMPAAAKRPAPEGTPDRESQARAKMQLAEVVPQVLEVDDPVTKVEMSAGTIAALRAMLREEINHGMADVEGRLAKKLEDNFGQLKTEIDAERDARQVLEERVRRLEKRPPTTTYGSNAEEEVDKNIAIIGSFAEKTIEEAEHLVREMMTHVHGFEDVMVRVNGKLMSMAHISRDGEVEWLDHTLCNDAVKEALDTFITEL